jgi:N-acylglucosamine 2-epimerase
METSQLIKWRAKFDQELFEYVVPFWEKYSPDWQYGGYFNALSRDGSKYDTSKYVWLQARQVWMFSTLWLKYEKRESWAKIAGLGAQFLKDHALRKDQRAYFSLSQEGEPTWMQRKIFSECFIVMAFAQYSRVSGESKWMEDAKSLFDSVMEWAEDLQKIGRPHYSGSKIAHSLAVPMILLNVIEELAGDSWHEYSEQIDTLLQRMLLHVKSDRKQILENVGKDGVYIDSIEGRVLNPGHSIEAGWFLQHWAQRLQRDDLSEIAFNMVRWSMDYGWDDEHQGLFYFLDAEGFNPTQLEWDMKLWWPHCEAMYATLLNYKLTGDEKDWASYEKVANYTFSHFPDHEHGEWYGYLNRRGEVTHSFKGGPYKGCFHVPRALWLCRSVLDEMIG